MHFEMGYWPICWLFEVMIFLLRFVFAFLSNGMMGEKRERARGREREKSKYRLRHNGCTQNLQNTIFYIYYCVHQISPFSI